MPEPETPQLPKAEFLTLVATLAGQATIGMGLVAHPITRAIQKDLKQAKFAIDMIVVLEEKTRGNLSAEERKVLDRVLSDLRMRWLEAAKS